MRQHGISDDDAEALVTGVAPADRPDLASLARSIDEFRSAAFASPPRPSAALRTRLELAPETEISPVADPIEAASTIDTQKPATARSVSFRARMKRVFAWFAGLGIAAKIVLGVSVAAAAGATGVGTAVGINSLVSTTAEQQEVAPAEDATDVPADAPTGGPENFGGSVSDRAHELGKDSDGAAFGEEISEEAQRLGEEKAQIPGEAGVDGFGPEIAERVQGGAPELPDVVSGGDD